MLIASGKAERVSWLVEDRAAALVKAMPGLDDVLLFPRHDRSRLWAHARTLRSRRDDVVLDLQGNLKSRMQLACLKAPRKLGFDAPLAKEGAQKGLTERFLPTGDTRHRIAANVAILARLGIHGTLPVERPVIPLGRSQGIQRPDPRTPRVLLHPGTSAFGQLKRWDPLRFARLGDRLVQERDAEVFVSAGPGENELAQAVCDAMHERARPLQPSGLDDLADELRATSLLVASDSLPLHLANALETPVLGLYGPKDPAVTGPYYPGARVVRSGVSCSPCTLRRCRDRICMEQLEADTVFEAARELLDGSAP